MPTQKKQARRRKPKGGDIFRPRNQLNWLKKLLARFKPLYKT